MCTLQHEALLVWSMLSMMNHAALAPGSVATISSTTVAYYYEGCECESNLRAISVPVVIYASTATSSMQHSLLVPPVVN
jgi:hypothetical protein